MSANLARSVTPKPADAVHTTAWWRVGMVWLVLGGPAVVVVAAIATAVVAYRGADPVLTEATDIIGEQAAETAELIRISILTAGSNVYYANAVAGRTSVASKMLIQDYRKIVRGFRRNRAKFISQIISASARMPSSAMTMRFLPSNGNGRVTTATVRMPSSLATSAITGAAPVPVPPPMPVVMNTMSVPASTSAMRSRSSSAA